jgi:hypothetical protein
MYPNIFPTLLALSSFEIVLTNEKCLLRSKRLANKRSFEDDIITQSRLMAVSDFYFGPVSIYYASENLEEKIREKNIRLFLGEKDCLLPGFVLFVNFAWVSIFYMHIFPLIPVPFVLITGGGDDVSTWRNDSKVIHHYGVNCMGGYDPRFFTCLPLGISDINVWGPSALPIMLNFSKSNVFRAPYAQGNKKNDILVAFSLNSHPYRTIVEGNFVVRRRIFNCMENSTHFRVQTISLPLRVLARVLT